MPPHLYCSQLPNSVFIRNVWPLLVAPIREMCASNLHSMECLDVLFHLRCVNSHWKWLVETSTEWAAFRIARFDSKGLTMRGTSADFARGHALREFKSALSLLTEPRKLTVAMRHSPLVQPFPDISDRWLIVLKTALENARDGIVRTPNLSDAYMYSPPEVGAVMSSDRVAVGKRLSSWHLDS